MGEINFISDNKNGKKNKEKPKTEAKIDWSTPVKEEKIDLSQKDNSWLSFFKKKKQENTDSGDKEKIDLGKINSSRQEVLQLIKDYEDTNKGKSSARTSLLSRLFGEKKTSNSGLQGKPIEQPQAIPEKPVPFAIRPVDNPIAKEKISSPETDNPVVLSKEPSFQPATVSPKAAVPGLFEVISMWWRSRKAKKGKIIEFRNLETKASGKEPSQAESKIISPKLSGPVEKDTVIPEVAAFNLAVEEKRNNPIKKDEVIVEKQSNIVQPLTAPISSPKPIVAKQSWLSSLLAHLKMKNGRTTAALVGQTQPNTLEMNLIKEELVFFFDWRENVLIMAASLFFTVFVMALIYGGLLYWEKSKNGEIVQLNSKYEELDSKISQQKDSIMEIGDFKIKTGLVSSLLSKHVYWSNLFDWFEKNTLADVYFFDFKGDIGGTYKISAQAKDFLTVAEQINFIRKNNQDNGFLNYVQTQEIGYGKDRDGKNSGANFSLDLSLNPNIFYAPKLK